MQEAAGLFLFTALGVWLMVMAVRLVARNVANAWANQQVDEISARPGPITLRWPRWAGFLLVGTILILIALANYSPGAFGWTMISVLTAVGLFFILAIHRITVNSLAPQEKTFWGFSVRVAGGTAAILVGAAVVQALFFGQPAAWISRMQFKQTILDRADQFGGWEPVVQAAHKLATSQSNQVAQIQWWHIGTNGFHASTMFRNRNPDEAFAQGENNKPPLPAELARLQPRRVDLSYTPDGGWTVRLAFTFRRGYSVTTRYSPPAPPAPAADTSPAPIRWRRVSDGVFEVY